MLVARRQGPPTVEATLWTQAVDGLLPLVVALGVERELLPDIKRQPHNMEGAGNAFVGWIGDAFVGALR